MSDPQPSGQLPGTQPAPEPATIPNQPLTAARVAPLIAKVIG